MAVTIRGWLFDFDNTLVLLEANVDWRTSRRELEAFLCSRGAPDNLFLEFPVRNLSLYEGLRARLRTGAIELKPPAHQHNAPISGNDLLRDASEIIERYELAGVDQALALPGAVELLHALRRCGAAIGIVTSNSSRTVNRWLEVHRLGCAANLVVGRDSGLALKPSPEMILRALDQLGLERSETILAGDSESDLEAAAAAGVRFCGIAANVTGRERLIAAGANEVLASPAEMGLRFGLLE